MAFEAKKVEVKTVAFDVEEAQKLLTLAAAAVGFPKYTGIQEAANRMLQKMEQDLEEKLAKVHEEEAKATAEAEAKKAAEAKAQAEKEAKGKAA
jgi:hypothetical protein